MKFNCLINTYHVIFSNLNFKGRFRIYYASDCVQKGAISETLFVIMDFVPFWVTLTYLQWLNVHFVPNLIDFFSFNNYVTPCNLYIHPTHFALSGKIDEILHCMGNFANISFDCLYMVNLLSNWASNRASLLAHLLTCLLGNFYWATERASNRASKLIFI